MPKKILVIANDITLAHLGRALTVATVLQAAGHDLTFATSKSSERFLTGFTGKLLFLAPTNSQKFLANLEKGKAVFSTADLCRMVVEDELLLTEVKPDLVIGDFRLSLGISARRKKIPYANITNAYWHPAVPARFNVPDIPLVAQVGLPLAQHLFKLARPAAFALHALPYILAQRHFGIKPVGLDVRKAYTDADLNLFSDTSQLYGLEKPVANGYFIGPIDWAPATELPSWYSDLDTKIPSIYVTMGSSGNQNSLDALVRGLAALNANILVATAGAPLRTEAPNIYAASYLPGALVLRHAALFISNGGSMSASQALRHGVPVLGVPSNLDQISSMAYLTKEGLGSVIRSMNITPDVVKATALQLMTDTEVGERTRAYASVIGTYQLEHTLVAGLARLGL